MPVEKPDLTPSGHHIVIAGRKWRATDPSIPDKFRAELVAELMAARRAIGQHDESARPRVQDAKVALGERGEPWWEPPTDQGLRDRLAATMRALLHHREPPSTICPSDAARTIGGTGWRGVMPVARSVAEELHVDGTLEIQQGGKRVDDVASCKGPIRLARGIGW